MAAHAEGATIDFTYADGNIEPWGKGRKERIDVAMCLSDPGLKGMKVKGFKAYITTTQSISSPSMWLSKSLKLQDKQNAPDVANYYVNATTVSLGDLTCGMLQVTLPEPYELDGKPLFLGYSISVEDLETDAQKQPVLISQGVKNSDGFWVHMDKSVLKWENMNEKADGVAYIVAEIEGSFSMNSLSFTGSTPTYTLANESFDALFEVSNLGANPVRTIGYTYSYDGKGGTFEGEVTLPTPVLPDMVRTDPVTLHFEQGISGDGKHDLLVTITEVNGEPNESGSPSIVSEVNIMPFLPKHRPLIEEFTGLWCQWCPRGYIGMEMVEEYYGDDQVSICYHYGDDMAVTENLPMPGVGFPEATIDRQRLIDPYFGSSDNTNFGIAYDIEKAMAERAIAAIELESAIEGDNVNFTVDVKFVADADGTNLRVGYVLLSSGLFNPKWRQVNAYSGLDGFQGTPLQQAVEWPGTVSTLVWNDIAVDVTGMMGIRETVPSQVVMGQVYSNDFTIDLTKVPSDLIQNRDNLSIAAFLVNSKTGMIINSNRCPVNGASSAVESVEEAETVSTEYYDLTGRRLRNPQPGIVIKAERKADGSSKICKIRIN